MEKVLIRVDGKGVLVQTVVMVQGITQEETGAKITMIGTKAKEDGAMIDATITKIMEIPMRSAGIKTSPQNLNVANTFWSMKETVLAPGAHMVMVAKWLETGLGRCLLDGTKLPLRMCRMI